MRRLVTCFLAAIILALPARAQWERIDTNIGVSSSATLVALDADHVYALLRLPANGSALYRSSDTGTSWESVASWPAPTFVPSVFAETGGFLVAAGESSGGNTMSVVSADQGASWTVAENAGFAIPKAIHAVGNELFLGTENVVARSTDGGATWANLPSSPLSVAALAGSSSVLAVGANGVLSRSTDGGDSWVAVGAPVPASQLTGMWVSNSSIYVKSILAQPFVSEDDGASWQQVALFDPFVYNTALASPNGGTWVLMTGLAAPYLSTDGGVSARLLTDGFPTGILGQPCTNATLVSNSHVVTNAWGCFNSNSGVYRFAHSGSTSIESGPIPVDVELAAYPNPTVGDATLTVSAPGSGAVTVELFDMLGRIIWQAPIRELAGDTEVEVPMGDLPGGTYFLRVATQEGIKALPLTRLK